MVKYSEYLRQNYQPLLVSFLLAFSHIFGKLAKVLSKKSNKYENFPSSW